MADTVLALGIGAVFVVAAALASLAMRALDERDYWGMSVAWFFAVLFAALAVFGLLVAGVEPTLMHSLD